MNEKDVPDVASPEEDVAPEVPTTFATKGVGWSGREEDDLKIIESDTPDIKPHTFRRSKPAGG